MTIVTYKSMFFVESVIHYTFISYDHFHNNNNEETNENNVCLCDIVVF